MAPPCHRLVEMASSFQDAQRPALPHASSLPHRLWKAACRASSWGGGESPHRAHTGWRLSGHPSGSAPLCAPPLAEPPSWRRENWLPSTFARESGWGRPRGAGRPGPGPQVGVLGDWPVPASASRGAPRLPPLLTHLLERRCVCGGWRGPGTALQVPTALISCSSRSQQRSLKKAVRF